MRSLTAFAYLFDALARKTGAFAYHKGKEINIYSLRSYGKNK